jgi:hypothetical protein
MRNGSIKISIIHFEVLELLDGEKPTLLQRKKTGDRILSKIIKFVDTFINGVVGKNEIKPGNGARAEIAIPI